MGTELRESCDVVRVHDLQVGEAGGGPRPEPSLPPPLAWRAASMASSALRTARSPSAWKWNAVDPGLVQCGDDAAALGRVR